MVRSWLTASLAACVGLLAAADLAATRYAEVSVPPSGSARYLSAEYRLWLPEGVRRLRSVIVKQHGCGDPAAKTGLEHANDLQWQALARKHRCALLGTRLPTGNRPCSDWCDPANGSGDAFVAALDRLAKETGHPELSRVPWALWGHSGGALWVTHMLCRHPERIAAVVAMRCGDTPQKTPQVLHTPLLWAIGEKDQFAACISGPEEEFRIGRRAGAPWTEAVEANTGHESSDTRLLAIPYLDAVLAARLPKRGDRLRDFEPGSGWLGNTATHEIAPASRYSGDPNAAAWLPNEETARKWQEYVSTGKIQPDRKPEEPRRVRAIRSGASDVVVAWEYGPDLENGLPSFHVYRNGALVGTVNGQRHNYGDAADPPAVALEFHDTGAPADADYTVAAFNALGEGARSSPVRAR